MRNGATGLVIVLIMVCLLALGEPARGVGTTPVSYDCVEENKISSIAELWNQRPVFGNQLMHKTINGGVRLLTALRGGGSPRDFASSTRSYFVYCFRSHA